MHLQGINLNHSLFAGRRCDTNFRWGRLQPLVPLKISTTTDSGLTRHIPCGKVILNKHLLIPYNILNGYLGEVLI